MLYPLKLKPAFKDYLWGGTRLRDDFGKECSFDKIAESWELSCHKDGLSIIDNGIYKGTFLAEYIEKEGKSVLGTNCERFDNFPVLIKLIDAKDHRSVQVHPENEYALRVEGEYGKTEMWYVVDCDEGAELLYGFKNNVSKEEFVSRIKDNTLLEITKSVPVKKGDVFFIEAGTLHAIGKGILIAEIQQNSNTTYRIYDYGRVGADGKPRQLHIDKAVDVTKLCPAKPYPISEPVVKNGYTEKLLSKCEYFTASALEIDGNAELYADSTSFGCILLLSGSGTIIYNNEKIEVKKGETIFIPAGMGSYTLSGTCTAIYTKID